MNWKQVAEFFLLIKKKPTDKLYWHCWHKNKYPQQFCVNFDARVKQIKETKPKDEQALRLKLFKPVKGKIGNRKLWRKLEKANTDWKKAYNSYQQDSDIDHSDFAESRQKVWDAYNNWQKSYGDFFDSINPDKVKALHAKECGCKYYEQNNNIFADGR